MSNDFDIGRGAASGRTGDAGARVFVLGAKDVNLAHVAGPGVDEYSEVKQVVDLTDFDLVMADLRTTGRSAGTYQGPAGWRILAANELFRFDFDQPVDVAKNKVAGGFDLVRQGEMGYGVETYSPDATACRTISKGSAAAQLEGVNVPQAFPAPDLKTYTLEWWMAFDCDQISDSSGVDPEILCTWDLNNGMRIRLVGAVGIGAHSWTVQISHRYGGITKSKSIAVYTITTSLPWSLFQLTFDDTLADTCLLYINGFYINASVGALHAPNQPAAGTPIVYGSPSLVGEVDATRLLDIAATAGQLMTSYDECVTAPAAIGHEWRMQILVDDVVLAERVIPETEDDRALSDFAAPVRQFRGPHEVAFRLVWATV
jgi:hypothetical protein